MRSLAAVIPASWRQARWLRLVIAGVRRRGRVLRVTGAALATLGLLSVAVFGGETPLWAQEAESDGVGIALSDLSDYPTHLTVDGFMAELTNLTATEEYQVTLSSDSAGLGIGGCGTASQKETVTGVAAQDLRFLAYACAVGEATVTAEVRRTGAGQRGGVGEPAPDGGGDPGECDWGRGAAGAGGGAERGTEGGHARQCAERQLKNRSERLQ